MQRPGSSSRGRAGGSLAQERRSVREQTPLKDRFSESLAARRSGIEEAACATGAIRGAATVGVLKAERSADEIVTFRCERCRRTHR